MTSTDLYQGEYELILGEDDTDVLFQIEGRPVKIGREVLRSYDQEGRFSCSMDDAKKLGLVG